MFPFDQISPAVSSHRQKNVELHRIFNSIDSSEKLIDGQYNLMYIHHRINRYATISMTLPVAVPSCMYVCMWIALC